VQMFPSDAVWNTRVDSLPVQRALSDIGDHAAHPFHVDFGSTYLGQLNGMPINVVHGTNPPLVVAFSITTYASQSDATSGNVPCPLNYAIEQDCSPLGTGSNPATNCTNWNAGQDRHMSIIDQDNLVLHEFFQATRSGTTVSVDGTTDTQIVSPQYSHWSLTSYALRPDGWTSTDAAGLPLAPLLVDYDQIQQALAIDPTGTTVDMGHALRFTLSLTFGPHIWPARHDANSGSAGNPPFGLRIRMKSSVVQSTISTDPINNVIMTTLKRYGAFNADNGGDWFFSGRTDTRWNDATLHDLTNIIPDTHLEVVDDTVMMVTSNSMQVQSAFGTPPAQGQNLTTSQLVANYQQAAVATHNQQNTGPPAVAVSSFKLYSLQPANSNPGDWGAGNPGVDLNTGVFAVVDNNLGLCVTITLSSSNVTLTAAQAQACMVRLTGTLLGNLTVTNPALGFYMVENLTTGSFTVTLSNGGVGSVVVPQGRSSVVFNDNVNNLRLISTQVAASLSGSRSPVNVGLTASVAANNLTINLVAADGTTPSSSDACLIPFRSTTLTTGQPTWLGVTSATSLTINSGNTLGTINSTPFRFWIVAINNAGTVQLGAINCVQRNSLLSNTVFPITPGVLKNTVAPGNNPGVIVAGSVLTNVPVCVLGYVEYLSGLATAGTYSAAPDIVQLMGPDIPTPGSVVQSISNFTSGSNTTSSSYVDVTGSATSITPTSAANLVRVEASSSVIVSLVSNVNTAIVQQMIRGSTPLLVNAGSAALAGAGAAWEGAFAYALLDAPQTSSSVTYKLQQKSTNTATATTGNTTIVLSEIMG
jgi:hypothetical protein